MSHLSGVQECGWATADGWGRVGAVSEPPLWGAGRVWLSHRSGSAVEGEARHAASAAISASTASVIAVVNGTSSWTASTKNRPALRSAVASSFPTRRSPWRIGSAK